MKTTRGFWRSRPAIADGAEDGNAPAVEAKRPRRPVKVALTLALSGTVGGLLVSFAFALLYRSESEVLVAGQKVPEEYVHSLVTTDFMQYVNTLQNVVLSTSHLQSMIQGLDLAKPGEEAKLMENIRSRFEVVPGGMPLMRAISAAEEENSNSR